MNRVNNSDSLPIYDASRGRNSCYQEPPAQTRTCGFPASGSSVVLAFAQSLRIKKTLDAVWSLLASWQVLGSGHNNILKKH
jgi:hypothetical protein